MQRLCGKAEHEVWWDRAGSSDDVSTGRVMQSESGEAGGAR